MPQHDTETVEIFADDTETAHTVLVSCHSNTRDVFGPVVVGRDDSTKNVAKALAVIGARIRVAGPEEAEGLADAVDFLARAVRVNDFVLLKTTVSV